MHWLQSSASRRAPHSIRRAAIEQKLKELEEMKAHSEWRARRKEKIIATVGIEVRRREEDVVHLLAGWGESDSAAGPIGRLTLAGYLKSRPHKLDVLSGPSHQLHRGLCHQRSH